MTRQPNALCIDIRTRGNVRDAILHGPRPGREILVDHGRPHHDVPCAIEVVRNEHRVTFSRETARAFPQIETGEEHARRAVE